MERFVEYVANGYAPFRMKNGAVVPWYPKDRWEEPDRERVNPHIRKTGKSESDLWIARIVDRIEAEGRMGDFKVDPNEAQKRPPNLFRDCILDIVALRRSARPTRRGTRRAPLPVILSH